MRRLDIMAAVGGPFSFAWRRWPLLLRLGWLPAVAFLGAVFLLGFTFALMAAPGLERLEALKEIEGPEALAVLGEFLSGHLPALAAICLILLVFGSAAMAMIGVPVQRLVISGEEPRGFFHLKMDGVRWRYLAVLLILQTAGVIVVLAGVAISYAVSGGSWWGPLKDAFLTGSEPDLKALAGLGGFVGLAFLLNVVAIGYLAIKFLLALPATAARGEMVLVGSWTWTSGNFWRIGGAWVLFFLGVMVCSIVFQIAVGLVQAVFWAFGLFVVQSASEGSAVAGILGFMSACVVIVAHIAFQAFSYALGFAFPALIYRQLVESD